MGIMKTLARVRENFIWANVKQDVHRYVTNCSTCQQTKYDHRRPPGLVCPLPISTRPWEDLSQDFIVGLPVFHGYSVILVVVDRFSKGIHLGLLPQHHTTSSMARTFMEISGKLHGMPRSLVSDRDLLFVNRFWQELFKLNGMKLCMSSAYHPQIDGQTEAMNRVIEQYLRAFVHQKPATWGRFLIWAEWSYNTSIHSAMGMTPFEVTFGIKPPSIQQYLVGALNVEAVDDWLIQRDTIFTSLVKKLNKAQQRMKKLTDRHQWDVSFNEGD